MPTLRLPHHGAALELAWGADALSIAAEPLARSFAAQIAAGAKFLPGQSVEIGFLRVTVDDAGGGDVAMRLDAPLKALVFARFSAQSFGVETLELPNSSAVVTVCAHLTHPHGFTLHRSAPRFEADSGWTVTCLDDHEEDGSDLHPVPIGELVAARPAAVKYLALPEGAYLVSRAGEAPRLWIHDDERPLVEGSYLHACFARDSFELDLASDEDLLDDARDLAERACVLAERYSLRADVARAAISATQRQRT